LGKSARFSGSRAYIIPFYPRSQEKNDFYIKEIVDDALVESEKLEEDGDRSGGDSLSRS
jgi:hypothetical protein